MISFLPKYINFHVTLPNVFDLKPLPAPKPKKITKKK